MSLAPPQRMASREVPHMLAQLVLGRARRRLRPALGRAVLAHHRARPPLRHPETRLEPLNGYATAVQGHHFPSVSSLCIALSSSASARSFLSRAFSTSSSLSRFAWLGLIPA